MGSCVYRCGSLGQIRLLLCHTLIFFKLCALSDCIIFFLRHLSPLNYQLIQLENFVFHSWASEIWLHISFSTLFSANKKAEILYTWKASLPMESYIHLSHANNPLLILWLYMFLLCLSPALHLFFHLTRISSPVVQFFFFLSYLQDSFCFHFVVFLCKISRAVILLCIFNLDIIYINFLTRSHDLQSK